MKTRMKYLLAAILLTATMTGCTLWEDEWSECLPPPEVDVPVTPDPWKPPVTDDKPTGN